MTAEERSRFYCGFSNEVLWPLFHDLQSRCNFDPLYWDAHVTVNQRFAEKTANEIRAGDLVWVHDYHLMSVAASLRQLGVTEQLAYFHHIPFPSPDIFEKLPSWCDLYAHRQRDRKRPWRRKEVNGRNPAWSLGSGGRGRRIGSVPGVRRGCLRYGEHTLYRRRHVAAGWNSMNCQSWAAGVGSLASGIGPAAG